MTHNKRAAVFASGTGSNFLALINRVDIGCEIVSLVCDRPDATVIDKAKAFGIDTFVFNPKLYNEKSAYESEIKRYLLTARIEWLFLAGYMRLIGPTLLNEFEGKILNIHPSLLPAFPGKDAIGQALDAGVNETGVTVHFVDEGMDTGPIIAQERILINKDDTRASLQERIQQVEHRLYPEVIKQLLMDS